MVDVFISYQRDDKRRAARIAKKLQELGLEVWLDLRIPSGTSFDTEIERALTSAKAVLVLWSKASVASDWVRNEAAAGKDRNVLVAAMLAPCELPLAFRSTQYVPLYRQDFADGDPSWIQIVNRIKDVVRTGPQTDAKQGRLIGKQRRRRFAAFNLALVEPIAKFALFERAAKPLNQRFVFSRIAQKGGVP